MRQQKTHLYQSHGDHRSAGQTDREYRYSTACGYVREAVTTDSSKVTCKLCLRVMAKTPNEEASRPREAGSEKA